MSNSSISKLLPMIPGHIRRFHGTQAKNAESIKTSGLKILPENTTHNFFNEKLTRLPEYKGIYTTVNPYPGYFSGTNTEQALVVLDIPKQWYQNVKRKAVNPEWPNPTPRPSRWDIESLDAADDVYYQQHKNDKGFLNFPSEVMDSYSSIVPIQQHGRADIFEQDIPKDFIKEILIPTGDGKFKTIMQPDKSSVFDNLKFDWED